MTDLLHQADMAVFYFINTDCANVIFDMVMPWLRNRFFWAPLYFFTLVFLYVNFPQDWLRMVVFAVCAVVLSDQISSGILKPLFHRMRPCHNFDEVQFIRLLVNCGSGFSFPSSHAANHFALAMFFIILFPNVWFIVSITLWASLVGFAQVYVGVHYPLDIIGGMLLGLFIGWVMGSWCRKGMNEK
jgi:undecaprenyl-diphosphatase